MTELKQCIQSYFGITSQVDIKTIVSLFKVTTMNKGDYYVQSSESSVITMKPRVLAFRPTRELRWIGHLLLPGLFDGEHAFELIDNGNGSTTFIQRETFKGILVPLFRKMLDVNTKNGFNAMNKQLKERVEKLH